MAAHMYVLGSLYVSQNWSHLNLELFVPVLFSLSRSMAINRSLPRLRNLAVVGELGRRK